jgi:hypothetical protein
MLFLLGNSFAPSGACYWEMLAYLAPSKQVGKGSEILLRVLDSPGHDSVMDPVVARIRDHIVGCEAYSSIQIEVLGQEGHGRESVGFLFPTGITAAKIEVVSYPGSLARKVTKLKVAKLMEKYEPKVI